MLGMSEFNGWIEAIFFNEQSLGGRIVLSKTTKTAGKMSPMRDTLYSYYPGPKTWSELSNAGSKLDNERIVDSDISPGF